MALPKVSSNLGWVSADGQRSIISDFRGRVLVLDFYATWCEPCRSSIPHLNRLQERFGKDGLQIVGLNVGGPDDRVKVPAFARELLINYPLGFPDKSLTDAFLINDPTIPQTFVLNRAGEPVKRYIGYNNSIGVEIERSIIEEVGRP